MAPSPLLDRRLLFVTGKGGVGRSTVTAALALLAVRAGKRVLVCETNVPQERIAPLLGAPPAGPEVREARPGLFTVNVGPREAMREYGLMVLRFKAFYDAVFENRLMRYFLRVIPSLSELVVLGKILHEVRSLAPDGRPRWDLVLVDAPATGHAVQLLRVPSALLDTVPAGPLRHDAQWMQRILVDPVRTAVALVTLPEELPVNEAVELDAQVRAILGMARAALVVNAVPPERFAADEAARLPALADAPPPLGPAAQAAHLQATRAAAAARHLARARQAIELPAYVIPLLPASAWGLAEVEAVASALAAGASAGAASAAAPLAGAASGAPLAGARKGGAP